MHLIHSLIQHFSKFFLTARRGRGCNQDRLRGPEDQRSDPGRRQVRVPHRRRRRLLLQEDLQGVSLLLRRQLHFHHLQRHRAARLARFRPEGEAGSRRRWSRIRCAFEVVDFLKLRLIIPLERNCICNIFTLIV